MKRKEHRDTAINTRYPHDVLEAVRVLAQQQQRSFNGMVMWILRDYISRQKGAKDAEKL